MGARVLQELVSHNACTKAGPSKAQLASEADKGCGSDWNGFSLSSDTASSSSSLASDPQAQATLAKAQAEASGQDTGMFQTELEFVAAFQPCQPLPLLSF